MYDWEHERLQSRDETGKIVWSQSIETRDCHVKEFGIYSVRKGIFDWGPQTSLLIYKSPHLCPLLREKVFLVYLHHILK